MNYRDRGMGAVRLRSILIESAENTLSNDTIYGLSNAALTLTETPIEWPLSSWYLVFTHLNCTLSNSVNTSQIVPKLSNRTNTRSALSVQDPFLVATSSIQVYEAPASSEQPYLAASMATLSYTSNTNDSINSGYRGYRTDVIPLVDTSQIIKPPLVVHPPLTPPYTAHQLVYVCTPYNVMQ